MLWTWILCRPRNQQASYYLELLQPSITNACTVLIQSIWNYAYSKISNISCTLVGNKIVDHSDVVGASPAGAAPTISSFSTEHLASVDCAIKTARRDEIHLSFGYGVPYIRDWAVPMPWSINPLQLCDTLWRHKSLSTLVEAMACCLM